MSGETNPKKARLFVSGQTTDDVDCYCGDLTTEESGAEARKGLLNFLQLEIDELATQATEGEPSEASVSISIKHLTDAEVAALPEI